MHQMIVVLEYFGAQTKENAFYTNKIARGQTHDDNKYIFKSPYLSTLTLSSLFLNQPPKLNMLSFTHASKAKHVTKPIKIQ